MPEPLNIVVSPFDIWTAPSFTAMPDIDEAPPVAWVKLGTNQSLEYNEDGVTIEHEQTVDYHRMLGSTGPRKATRSEEGLRVEVTVHDFTIETYAKHIGGIVTTVAAGAGAPGTKATSLYRGLNVATMALLVRGASPYVESQSMQWYVPHCVNDGEPEIMGSKEEPAGLLFSFYAIEDDNAVAAADRFGKLIAYQAAALP